MVQPSASPKSLPAYIVGKPQLLGFLRDLQYLDDRMHQQKLTESIHGVRTPMATSTRLEELAQGFDYDLDVDQDRLKLMKDLREIIATAPEYHISFASEPPADKLQQLVGWLREAVHPQILVQTGSQPSIVAGCTIRTKNKVIDMSLRRSFEAASPVLLKGVQAL